MQPLRFTPETHQAGRSEFGKVHGDHALGLAKFSLQVGRPESFPRKEPEDSVASCAAQSLTESNGAKLRFLHRAPPVKAAHVIETNAQILPRIA